MRWAISSTCVLVLTRTALTQSSASQVQAALLESCAFVITVILGCVFLMFQLQVGSIPSRSPFCQATAESRGAR